MLEVLGTKRSEFDILCFTETNLDANILDRDLARQCWF